MTQLLAAVYIGIPTYITNGMPVLFGGGRPIDLGRTLSDGQRIFGDNKTINGFLAGLTAGILASALMGAFLARELFLVGALATIGALLGDLMGAFVKRRLRMAPGAPLPVVDQLDFIAGALLLVSPVFAISTLTILVLIVATLPIHVLTNALAYRFKLKDTFW